MSRTKHKSMGLIEIQIIVDTEELINQYPNGSSVNVPNKYIQMSIVGGKEYASSITGSGGAELGFYALQNTDLRFFGVPKTTVGNVQIVSSGNLIPTDCLVNGKFDFEDGVATGKTVGNAANQVAYNFVMRVDNFDFTFTWDPFLGVSNAGA
jgi:hypothetical protein